jgi:uncharacterized membrane protein YqaE (UPF0057 family)
LAGKYGLIFLAFSVNEMIMRYFLCFLCPPIAILTTGKMGSFILNIILTIFFWIPGIIHAVLVVNKYYEDRRHRQLMSVVRRRY